MTTPGPDDAVRRLDFLPWEYAQAGIDANRERQAERHRQLAGTGKTELAADVYVAESAAAFCDELRMGQRSYIAAHAYVTGEISLGSDSTINPFSVVRGRITVGDGVRIGADLDAGVQPRHRGDRGADVPDAAAVTVAAADRAAEPATT